MEYTKDYGHIQFKVTYSVTANLPDTLSFAAEPFERLNGQKLRDGTANYLLYGRVRPDERLEIGFRPFTFLMTQNLHTRLGLLYETVQGEYRRVMEKK